MSVWEEIKLGDVVKINASSVGANYPFDEILYLDTGSITKGKIDSLQRMRTNQAPSRAKRLVLVGDILYSTVRPIQRHYGYVTSPEENLVVSTGFAVISCNHAKLLPKFLYYCLTADSIVEELEIVAEASTSTYPSLKPSDIECLELRIPLNLVEQRAIAGVLSSLDDKIDLLHRQNKTLEALAETLFRQWFVEEANDDWEEICIGDVADLNSSTVSSSYEHREILYLDTSSLTDGKFRELQQLSIQEAPSRAKRLVKHNDVLISTVRPDQRHYGIVKSPVPNLVVSTGFCVITATAVDPHILYFLLTGEEMTQFLHSIAEGSTSTYPSLKPSDLAALTFSKPPKSRHDEFAAIASESWDKITCNSSQIRTLEKLRDTLLPKLMSGEVRVQYE